MSYAFNYIQVAINTKDNEPVMAGKTFKDLKEALDDYYGADGEQAEYLGWTPSEDPNYQGVIKYKWYREGGTDDKIEWEPVIDTLKVYEIWFNR